MALIRLSGDSSAVGEPKKSSRVKRRAAASRVLKKLAWSSVLGVVVVQVELV